VQCFCFCGGAKAWCEEYVDGGDDEEEGEGEGEAEREFEEED
jgi:hypothetical protein